MSGYVDIFKLQEQELVALNQRVDELKRRYELYFLGIDKRQPGPERERLERDVRRSKLHRTMKTELRFRFRQFLARLRTYTQYWDRVCREIEEGTYKRGALTQAERLAALQAEAAMKRAQGVEAGQTGGDDAESDRIAAAAQAAAAFLARSNGAGKGAPSTPRAPQGGVSDLYRAYVEAKQSRGEDVSRISYSSFAKSVERQRTKAREKLGQDVDLRVKVSSEKVTLVASRRRAQQAAERKPASPPAPRKVAPEPPAPKPPAQKAPEPPVAPPPPPRVHTVPPGPPRSSSSNGDAPTPPREPAKRPPSRTTTRRAPPPPPPPRRSDDI